MLSFKMLGALIIISTSSEIGRRWAKTVELPVQILTDLIFALQGLETEISYALNPLQQAARRVAAGAQTSAVAGCFNHFADSLSERYESSSKLWLTTVETVLAKYPLAEKDLQLIGRLGDQLGLTNRDDQVKHIRQVRIALEASLAQAKEQCERYQGLYRKIGVTIGLAVVLLTW
ncbi:MAG: hypothetical protein GX058_07260 [Firmicutes bacterium]|nr:hypothetical protein [Bacillota bacterium]